MDTCSAVMLSGHKPHVADAVIEAVSCIGHIRKAQDETPRPRSHKTRHETV